MPTIFVCGKCGAASGMPNSSCPRVMTLGRCGFYLGNYETKEVTPAEFEELMHERANWDLRTAAVFGLLLTAAIIFVGTR